jgi:hypothetical protein
MFMLVIIHRAYVLKIFFGIIHLDRNHGCLQEMTNKRKKEKKLTFLNHLLAATFLAQNPKNKK